MPDLREYEVMIGGVPHTLLLDEESATRAGVKPKEKTRETVQNKSRRRVSDKSKEG